MNLDIVVVHLSTEFGSCSCQDKGVMKIFCHVACHLNRMDYNRLAHSSWNNIFHFHAVYSLSFRILSHAHEIFRHVTLWLVYMYNTCTIIRILFALELASNLLNLHKRWSSLYECFPLLNKIKILIPAVNYLNRYICNKYIANYWRWQWNVGLLPSRPPLKIPPPTHTPCIFGNTKLWGFPFNWPTLLFLWHKRTRHFVSCLLTWVHYCHSDSTASHSLQPRPLHIAVVVSIPASSVGLYELSA